MDILKTVLMILFAIDCIALTVIVLMQERTFYGRRSCKIYEVCSCVIYRIGSSIEFESICLIIYGRMRFAKHSY